MHQVLTAQLSTSAFLVAWTIAAGTSVAVFLHANRHGGRHATAWGVGVFLFLGLILPIYVLHYRRTRGSGRRY